MEDKLIFFSSSKDNKIGKNKNEFINNEDEYIELNKIKNFRRYLSNFDIYEFKYNGYSYRTIEHAFQGTKISLANKEEAFKFTIDSNHDIGLGDGKIARKNRKLVNLTKEQIKEWDNIKHTIMYDIALEKFKVSSISKDVLLKTNNCQLWHTFPRMKYPIRCYYLEKIRTYLKEIDLKEINKKLDIKQKMKYQHFYKITYWGLRESEKDITPQEAMKQVSILWKEYKQSFQ
jgi:predicted NAD-dependent protein-ADP-ribosyltransferase YbiA (DUF1768 family)